MRTCAEIYKVMFCQIEMIYLMTRCGAVRILYKVKKTYIGLGEDLALLLQLKKRDGNFKTKLYNIIMK